MTRPARPWFRFYVEAFADRKLRRLPPAQRWLFAAVLGAARQSPEPGRLLVADGDPFTVEDMADFAGMPTSDVRKGMAALVRAQLVEHKRGVWSVPSWADRQYESDVSTDRVRQFRERRRNVSSDVAATRQRSETDTDSPKPPARAGGRYQPPSCEECRDTRLVPHPSERNAVVPCPKCRPAPPLAIVKEGEP